VSPAVLSVAGSDPSGGAGLQSDIKTIHAHGCYALAVPSLITVQSTQGVRAVQTLDAELVRAQLEWLLQDLRPAAAKTGALGSASVVRELAALARQTDMPWVVDPVLLPTDGASLGEPGLAEALRDELLPEAALVTPNASEAEVLAQMQVRTLQDAREAARRLASLGARAVLVKGGHLQAPSRGTDVLFSGGQFHQLAPSATLPRVPHGTGCALSAAIASRLALGEPLLEAVTGAKAWLTRVAEQAFSLGQGALVLDHFHGLTEQS
jgi:hydroxymethylpyrimidine/phosphomethylpyrimidine kinase